MISITSQASSDGRCLLPTQTRRETPDIKKDRTQATLSHRRRVVLDDQRGLGRVTVLVS